MVDEYGVKMYGPPLSSARINASTPMISARGDLLPLVPDACLPAFGLCRVSKKRSVVLQRAASFYFKKTYIMFYNIQIRYTEVSHKSA